MLETAPLHRVMSFRHHSSGLGRHHVTLVVSPFQRQFFNCQRLPILGVIPVAMQTGIHSLQVLFGGAYARAARRTPKHPSVAGVGAMDPGLHGNRDDGARGGAVPKQLALIATRTGPRKRAQPHPHLPPIHHLRKLPIPAFPRSLILPLPFPRADDGGPPEPLVRERLRSGMERVFGPQSACMGEISRLNLDRPISGQTAGPKARRRPRSSRGTSRGSHVQTIRD
jgi:hypothetical protein